MNRYRRRTCAAAIAGLFVPAAVVLAAPPATVAATALFAEGATRPSGEAQTAFGGVFCETNTCRSVGRGTVSRTQSAAQIQSAVDSTPGDLLLVGYSVGGAGLYDRLRAWEQGTAPAPDPERVVMIVTFGNPENKFGGENRKQPGTGLPATQPYEHLDVSAQYDGVSDNPTRFGIYSYINTAIFSRHFSYFEDLDINDPDNLVYQEGNTTYMLIPAKTLPMLQWLDPFLSDERMAELDAKYRPLVEKDYDRPAYVPQGEGADWGNGNPPPSVSGDRAQVVTDEPEESVDPDRTTRRASSTSDADDLDEIDDLDEPATDLESTPVDEDDDTEEESQTAVDTDADKSDAETSKADTANESESDSSDSSDSSGAGTKAAA